MSISAKHDIPLFTSASMAANADSTGVLIGQCSRFSGVITWVNTSSPLGTFRLQVSNDDVTYYDRSDGDTEFTGSANGTATSATFNFCDLGWKYARIRYVRTSGGAAGTLSGVGSVKE